MISNRKPETGSFFQRDRLWHPPAYAPGYKTTVLRSPKYAYLSLDNTISEITGPVFGHGILGELDNDLVHNFARPGEAALGPRIIVHGRVLDERARPVPGVLIEVWQANAGGRYRHKKDGYLATLDPNARTLLKVEIKESTDADDIFTALMGDLVEPRRDFINDNALSVANLDI